MLRLVTCTSIVTFGACLLSMSMSTQHARAGTVPKTDRPAPEITFEKVIHDFGEIGTDTENTCEFKFTNTGNALLKIGEIKCPCGCTIAELPKKKYAPGESGAVKITYRASGSPGVITKSCTVPSNDKKKPAVTVTIKTKIVLKVVHQPERLNLLLKRENAGCPAITLTSRDKRPFTIKHFKSTGNAITADYDSLVKATKFILQPKVDFEKLQKGLRGNVEISLTHPECKTVRIVFDTLPEFKVLPRVVYIRDAEPKKAVKKKVSVLNNYSEDFEIESVTSKKGTIKVLVQKKVRSGYEFELQVTPTASKDKKRMFTDVLFVKIKDGQQLQITFYGIYSRKGAKASR